METTIAKAGRLLCADEGEYSDYGVMGFFVIIQDFKPLDLLSEYLAEHPDETQNYGFKSYQFLAFLIQRGLLLEIPYSTLYLGGYGNADAVKFHAGPTE